MSGSGVGVATAGETLVLDHTTGEVGEDWSQGGETLAVCYFSNGGGSSAAGTIQGDSGADRTIVAATTVDENGVTTQNLGISLWQEQGGRSEYVPEPQG